MKQRLPICLLAIAVSAITIRAQDWPARGHDVRRGGVTAATLTGTPSLNWTIQDASPAPAWTESPAGQDFWQRYFNLKPRQAFDRCNHVVVAGGRVYYGSSRTGAVTALNAADGSIAWKFYTDGPVRFAPQVEGGRIFFGSDDGFVYCLSAGDGSLIWKERAGPSDQTIWGNQHPISVWPVRTSVLVDDGDVFWVAGILRQEGFYLCRRKAADGSGGWTRTPVKPHQGYLVASADRLFVPSGKTYPEVYDRATGNHVGSVQSGSRDGGCWALLTPGETDFWFGPQYGGANTVKAFPAGGGGALATVGGANELVSDATHAYYVTDATVVKLRRSDNAVVWSRNYTYPHAIIKAGDHIYVGGNGEIAELSDVDGAITWTHAVAGAVYGLAVADETLYASTDTGQIAAFTSNLPSVTTGAARVFPGGGSVSLKGTLLSPGSAATTVFCSWGLADGGADPAAWDHTANLGVQTTGDLEQSVIGLLPDSSYCFRFWATNAYGAGWAEESAAFITGAVELDVGVPEAYEEDTVAGSVVFTRPAAASAHALTVNYTVAGTAGAQDLLPLSGQVVFPAGEQSVTEPVVPIDDLIMNEGIETVWIRLAPGGYLGDAGQAVEIRIVDNDVIDHLAYPYGMRVTFTGYEKSESLVDFPALIRLDESIPGFEYSQFTRPGNGGDLRITDATRSTLLPYEIERWDPNGISAVWVRIPLLSGTNTAVRLFWGHATHTNPPPSTVDGSVWENGFGAVWHMNETTGPTLDATANTNHGSPLWGVNQTADGMIAGGDEYDGLNDSVTIPAGPSLNLASLSEWTMEAWIKTDGSTSGRYTTMLSYGRWGASLGLDDNTLRLESWENNSAEAQSTLGVSVGQWAHVALVHQPGTRTFYLNGVNAGSGGTDAIGAQGTDFRLGYADDRDGNYSKYDGVLDEARVSRVRRSPDWLWATWRNVSSGPTFATCSPVFADDDRDGIEDQWEMDQFNSLSEADQTTDTDLDGDSDFVEYMTGTDPLEPASVSRLEISVPPAGETLTIIWTSARDRAYRLESKEDLTQPWLPTTSAIPATPPQNTHTVNPEDADKLFFRLNTDYDPGR